MDWPLVDKDDDGIRPAGLLDECFYCRQKIGQLHGQQCVVVTKVVAMIVEGAGLRGVWTLSEPHFWTAEDCEFHKNESTWCADNFLDEAASVAWDTPGAMEKLQSLLAAAGDGSCLCSVLKFKFLRVVDEQPRRLLRSLELRA